LPPFKTDTDVRLYRSISDVSELVGVKPHVLRYWETQFSMLRPRKNRAGNRMYRPEDVTLLMRIRDLLYARRFTIEGARKHLLDARRDGPQQEELRLEEQDDGPTATAPMTKIVLHELKSELRQLLARLK
jgi:DNA-binding transcriptional MerR regulator